jgi:hypothetical protein
MHLLASLVVRLDESQSTVQDILAGTFVDVVMASSATTRASPLAPLTGPVAAVACSP